MNRLLRMSVHLFLPAGRGLCRPGGAEEDNGISRSLLFTPHPFAIPVISEHHDL